MRGCLLLGVLLFGLLLLPFPAPAQAGRAQRTTPRSHADVATAPVLMLSDFHFDPLRDPGKFERLRSTPAAGWQTILEEPDSADQAAAFAALQSGCKARGLDSSWTLVQHSLDAARLHAPGAAFAVVAGDLLVHGLDCRLRALAPTITEAETSAFAAKTVAFLALAFRQALSGLPVYMALGNNDSGCVDYRETPGSAFLSSAGKSFASVAPGNAANRKAFESFSTYGDYNVALPAPLQRARLIVLQDIFESARYAGCDRKAQAAPEPETAQIAWLREQLEHAQGAHEHVWVMAHIPPGVDVYSSFRRYVLSPARMCEVTAPTMFLHTDALAETIASFPDVVSLALFSHTHMDELKWLHRPGGKTAADGVPAKLIPSISPVNGNRPSFLVAQVAASNARMLDYTDFVAGDPEGTRWSQAYSFRSTYGVPDFSAASVAHLTASMRADRGGSSAVSRAYRRWFFPGDTGLMALGLAQIWPAYSCAASQTSTAGFRQCLCPPAERSPGAAAGDGSGKMQ